MTRGICCLLLISLLAAVASAQVSANVTGTVVDPNGSAAVTAQSLETGQTRDTTTNQYGRFSAMKNTLISERWTMQFRAEIFNLLNRANFNTPNLITFTPPTVANPTGVSGTAGAITSTSTTSRQVQFGIKLLW